MIKLKIVVIIVIAVVLLILASIMIFIFSRGSLKRIKRVIVDEEFMTKLISFLGDISNILSSSTENGRLIIKVNDLDKVDLNGIKSMAENGVFVTGNTIKTLFRLDSKIISDELEKRL